MIKKIVTLLICLMPVTFMGQVLKQHQHEESSGTGLGNGEVFSPFRDNPTDSTKSRFGFWAINGRRIASFRLKRQPTFMPSSCLVFRDTDGC